MPAHPLFLKLLRACERPLAAPSANPFGYISPTSAAHVWDSLGGKIAHILDGGEAEIGLESTILDLRDSRRPVVLRPGAISAKEISRALGRRVGHAKKKTGDSKTAALAPGMLSKHYSPRTPIVLHRKLSARFAETLTAGEAVMFVFKPKDASKAAVGDGKPLEKRGVFWLSERGDLRRAARRLFAVLRALDDGKWTRIHAELAPGREGFALAINDRLTRAAAKR
jgi:L-threonylcarbamoyladenylate synthase